MTAVGLAYPAPTPSREDAVMGMQAHIDTEDHEGGYGHPGGRMENVEHGLHQEIFLMIRPAAAPSSMAKTHTASARPRAVYHGTAICTANSYSRGCNPASGLPPDF